jgi:hypothetical protein
VLAPGYNVYHYDHIHVDLMHRRAGYRPCRPDAIPGEVVAARARAVYASKHRVPAYTGSVTRTSKLPIAVPGQDGYVAGDDDVTGSIGAVLKKASPAEQDFDEEPEAVMPARKSAAAIAGDAAIRAEELRSIGY